MAHGPSAAPTSPHACRRAGRALLGVLRLEAVRRGERPRSSGQALVEFAILIPILFVLIMGLLEFAVAFNATLTINRASQNAAHTASIAGNQEGADCLILQEIENDVGPPQNKTHIKLVQIQRTALAGNVTYGQNQYVRTGSTSCTMNDGTSMSVPYTRIENGYPVNQRCNVLSGCPTYTPARSTVDNVGVLIQYRYDWITPLGNLLPFVGGQSNGSRGWTFQKRNIFRMEPNL